MSSNTSVTSDAPPSSEDPGARRARRRRRLYSRLYRVASRWRRVVVLGIYGAAAALAYGLGFLLRFEFGGWERWGSAFLATAPLVALVRIGLAGAFRLSVWRWRFISTVDVLRLFAATTTGSVLLLAARELLGDAVLIPRSVVLIEWVLTTYITGAIWVGYRTGFERLRHVRASGNGRPKRAVILGAGEAGNLLAREIQRYPTGYRLVAFVDDDALKHGCRIRGIPVYGGTDRLPQIVRSKHVDEVILAIPSARPAELRRLVEQCEAASVPFKVLPGIAEVLSGDIRLTHLRELRIEDLLGREPVTLELPELAEDLGGRCVLITGAAGSIGSELARQVAVHHPRRLVLLDQAETDLFFLELELRASYPDIHLAAVMCDIVDEGAVDRIFEEHRPDRVFHAAAYKHVPLLEHNPEQAILNNTVGTRVVAEAAGRAGAGKFILVSTDKAVRPSSIMGASKRLAELVTLGLQERFPATAFGAVRFGNVLGSQGSVIPVFQRQIERVEPLTVTHPEVTRYFMTIPEAVQLILQASVLEELAGHIAMLDMGEPIRILELASNMLRLAGLPCREGETIVFTGLRPGEKIHEELSGPDETTSPTAVPKVRIIQSTGTSSFPALPLLDRWAPMLRNGGAPGVVDELRGLFDGLQAVDAGSGGDAQRAERVREPIRA